MNTITIEIQEVRYEKVITGSTLLYLPTENIYTKFGNGALACIAPKIFVSEVIGLWFIKTTQDKVSKEYFPISEILDSPLTKNEDLIELKRLMGQKDWYKYDMVSKTTFDNRIANLIDEINNI